MDGRLPPEAPACVSGHRASGAVTAWPLLQALVPTVPASVPMCFVLLHEWGW